MKMLGFGLMAIAMMLGLALQAGASGVRAWLDRTEIQEGEGVVLTIEADGLHGGVQPDLTPLKEDFDILGTRSGTRIQITNGQRSDTTTWSISLQPRDTGTIDIPPLRVGKARTAPLTLKVGRLPEPDRAEQSRSLFVELEADTGAGALYVQQQLPLTVRLYSALPIREGTLSDPSPADAVVERLGEDRHYETVRDGRRYRVIERRYAIFPERSGDLEIPAVVFRGRVQAPRSQRGPSTRSPFDDPFFRRFFDDDLFGGDVFGAFDPGRPVSARSNRIALKVSAVPASYRGGTWLPAEDVTVHDSWTDSPPQLKVGEPVTRVITITAAGLAGSQIPGIPLPSIEGVRIYPEQVQHESRTDGTRITGISRQAMTLIPRRPGSLHVPETRIIWWDVQAQRERQAVVPAWEFHVAAGSASAAVGATTNTGRHGSAHPGTPAGDTQEVAGFRDWRYPAIVGLMLLAAAGLALVYLRRRSRGPAVASVDEPPEASRQEARTAFLDACRADDARAAARAILAWAGAEWPHNPPASLGQLAGELAAGAAEVRALETCLYAGDGCRWSGAPLASVLAGGLIRRAPTAPPEQAPVLEPLYPSHA